MKFIFLITACLLPFTAAHAQVTSFTLDSANFNKPMMVMLDSLYKNDQQPRLRLTAALKLKNDVRIIDSIRKVVKQQDAINLSKVNAIIQQYGWLGPQKVGMEGSQALFLVIQHADLATQQRYLPLIKAAEQRGEILSSNVALMEDRISMRTGKKQVYGSQAFTDSKTGSTYIYPIADLEKLDSNRKRMGLEPMALYAQRLGIQWDIAVYKAMLPQIEAMAAARKF